MRASGGQLTAAILGGGITAGILDFVAACLIYSIPPARVARAIARGWYGPAAMKGGTEVVAVGALSHFAILIVGAAIFVGAALRAPVLRQQWVVAGLVFGACVYGIMHYVVVPLSNAPNNPPTGRNFWLELASHLLVGLAIAAWTRAILKRA